MRDNGVAVYTPLIRDIFTRSGGRGGGVRGRGARTQIDRITKGGGGGGDTNRDREIGCVCVCVCVCVCLPLYVCVCVCV